MQPIYYVVIKHLPYLPSVPYAISQIIKSIPCTVDDIPRLWEEEIGPHLAENYMPMIFVREPKNPFQEVGV